MVDCSYLDLLGIRIEGNPIRQELLRLLLVRKMDELRVRLRTNMKQPDVDGALVGGASLDPEEFAKIAKFHAAQSA